VVRSGLVRTSSRAPGTGRPSTSASKTRPTRRNVPAGCTRIVRAARGLADVPGSRTMAVSVVSFQLEPAVATPDASIASTPGAELVQVTSVARSVAPLLQRSSTEYGTDVPGSTVSGPRITADCTNGAAVAL